jgi:hypothetical protein
MAGDEKNDGYKTSHMRATCLLRRELKLLLFCCHDFKQQRPTTTYAGDGAPLRQCKEILKNFSYAKPEAYDGKRGYGGRLLLRIQEDLPRRVFASTIIIREYLRILFAFFFSPYYLHSSPLSPRQSFSASSSFASTKKDLHQGATQHTIIIRSYAIIWLLCSLQQSRRSPLPV